VVRCAHHRLHFTGPRSSGRTPSPARRMAVAACRRQ
jgi:hypothetical protein